MNYSIYEQSVLKERISSEQINHFCGIRVSITFDRHKTYYITEVTKSRQKTTISTLSTQFNEIKIKYALTSYNCIYSDILAAKEIFTYLY